MPDEPLPPPPDLPPPPALPADAGLFLDFDGTLVEFAARPDAVVVDAGIRAALAALAAARPGRVAVVSGRAIAGLDMLLGADLAGALALSGSHGVEVRAAGIDPDDHGVAMRRLAPAEAELAAFAEASGLLLERKTLGAALHYRQMPHRADEALAAARDIAARHGLALQRGKMMVEVRVAGDKGQAVDRLMATPAFRGATPVFVGDDVTDEDGFRAAARHGGMGVLVGPPRATAARFALADVAAVRAWLAMAAGERTGWT